MMGLVVVWKLVVDSAVAVGTIKAVTSIVSIAALTKSAGLKGFAVGFTADYFY